MYDLDSASDDIRTIWPEDVRADWCEILDWLEAKVPVELRITYVDGAAIATLERISIREWVGTRADAVAMFGEDQVAKFERMEAERIMEDMD